MASKMIGTVARSLPMPAAPQGDLVQQIIDALTAAAAQEGVILHHRDLVGVPRKLVAEQGSPEDAFSARLQQAMQQATGVQLKVLLYCDTVDPDRPMCSLCTLMAGGTPDRSIVLVQGAAL